MENGDRFSLLPNDLIFRVVDQREIRRYADVRSEYDSVCRHPRPGIHNTFPLVSILTLSITDSVMNVCLTLYSVANPK